MSSLEVLSESKLSSVSSNLLITFQVNPQYYFYHYYFSHFLPLLLNSERKSGKDLEMMLFPQVYFPKKEIVKAYHQYAFFVIAREEPISCNVPLG